MSVSVTRFENTPVPSNCYLIQDDLSGRIIVVDPGTKDMSSILDNIKIENIDNIILTHEHFDHCAGCNYLLNRLSVPIICSQYCAEAIADKKKNLSVFYDQIGFKISNHDVIIPKFGDAFDWCENKFMFWNTEGHSVGCICFLIDNYLFSGDTLIENLKTVTKLKTGSKEKLLNSIRFIESMKGNGYMVCPGHGNIFDLDTYDLNKAII